jgi:hypothetical protein
MNKAIAASIALMASAAADAAPTQTPREVDACASLNRLGGVRALDNTTAIIMWAGGRPAYVVKLSVPLPELRFAHRYAYIDRDGDGQLCGRSRDGIVLPDEAMRMPATIMSMTELDAEHIEALEDEYKVKLTSKSKNKDAEPGLED